VKITVLANRTPIVADVSVERTFDKTIALFGAGPGRYGVSNEPLSERKNAFIPSHFADQIARLPLSCELEVGH
jgi:hypothetical protein